MMSLSGGSGDLFYYWEIRAMIKVCNNVNSAVREFCDYLRNGKLPVVADALATAWGKARRNQKNSLTITREWEYELFVAINSAGFFRVVHKGCVPGLDDPLEFTLTGNVLNRGSYGQYRVELHMNKACAKYESEEAYKKMNFGECVE